VYRPFLNIFLRISCVCNDKCDGNNSDAEASRCFPNTQFLIMKRGVFRERNPHDDKAYYERH
jgi:hypothetical protein